MASIVKRNKSYAVVYGYWSAEGIRKQKWETYYTYEAAIKRKEKIENPILFLGEKIRAAIFNDLLDEYIQLHGQFRWSFSTYDNKTRLINNYIRPFLGEVKLFRIDRHLISRYFYQLQNTSIANSKSGEEGNEYISEIVVFEVYKLLHNIFHLAVSWGYFQENIVKHLALKQPGNQPRMALNPVQVATLINEALQRRDYMLALMLHLAFTCSMRKGEILGLCWDDINFDNNSISVNKELLRVSVESLAKLSKRGIYFEFPSYVKASKSCLILKKPKTNSSIRMVYMTQSLAKLLKIWKEVQSKYAIQNNCQDFKLVLAQKNGRPFCPHKCNKDFQNLLRDLGLPKTVFHSLRHSSTSYKLILSGGNIKAVQGDNGHAQPNMVLSVYAQIHEEDRIKLAENVEADFCSNLRY